MAYSPIEQWRPFEAWRAEHGIALEQSLFEFTSRISEPLGEDAQKALKSGLFVIGDHSTQGTYMVTLLDMTEDFFDRNRHVLTLLYDAQTDRFEIAFGPIMSDNVYSGLHQSLRALKSDL